MQEEISSFDLRETHYIVGRDQEIALFRNFLEGKDRSGKNLWNLFGTGGVGKSTLLQLFRLYAHQAGACYILLDSRDFSHTETDLYKALLKQLKISYPLESDQESLLE
ncbi:MAG: ATP-binding protein, partial [Clostridia bacterium]